MKILLDEEIQMEAAKSKTFLQVDLEILILSWMKLAQFTKEDNDAGK